MKTKNSKNQKTKKVTTKNSTKNSTTNNWGKHIKVNPSGTYRVRMMINGTVYDKSIPTITKAKQYRNELLAKRK